MAFTLATSAVNAAAAQLRAAVPAAYVYERGVPWATDAPSPVDRYAVVRSNGGVWVSDDLAGSRGVHDVALWVTVVAEGAVTSGASEQDTAARCEWLLARCQSALAHWRPVDGWRPLHIASQPLTRDDDVADRVVVYAVDQWSLLQRH